MSLSDYQSALDYIHSFDDPYRAALRDHGKQTWGLSKISGLLEKLGNPHLAYPTIHVAGTKGKGSTSAIIAQGLTESGLKTGLYISPHLEDWRERIQIDRRLIAEAELAALVAEFKALVGDSPDVSAFEVTTALAFLFFARQHCDAAVIEVGLGGRLDATSVVQPLVSVIANISMDHMQLLGDTLAEIAGEKAAIIKPGTPVVSAPQLPDPLRVIEAQAEAQRSRLILVGRDWKFKPLSLSLQGSEFLAGRGGDLEQYQLNLSGRFQIENAVVALAALAEAQRAGLPISSAGCRAALAKVVWPGRMEIIEERPLIVIDSAHTPYSMEQLILSLRELTGQDEFTFVFGCMADKDVDGMLQAMLPVARRVIFTQAENERAATTATLSQRSLEIGAQPEGGSITLAASIEQAVRLALDNAAPDDILCVAGSLSVAGAARTVLLRERSSPESGASGLAVPARASHQG